VPHDPHANPAVVSGSPRPGRCVLRSQAIPPWHDSDPDSRGRQRRRREPATEVEALQLEYNRIKEFDLRFNVRYRYDKSHPVLAVTLSEEFPRLMVYRGPRRKGVRHFGPYSHAWAIRETLDLLTRVFPARSCSAGVFKRPKQIDRPCLLGYIDKCSAPCIGRVSPEQHGC
jgi:excinuclease ABC subunit C